MRPIMAKAINYMKPDIDPNTRLYVPFNEGVGDLAKDYSQYGNHAQLTDVEWSPDGFNGAGKFNGSSSLGDVSTHTSLNTVGSIAIRGYVKRGAINGYQHIAGKRTSGVAEVAYLFRFEDGNTIKMHISSDGGSENYESFETTNTFTSITDWYYVIGVFDGIDTKVYVNGVSEAGTTTGAETSIFVNPGNLKIGAISDAPEYFLNGIMNNIIITVNITNPAQIAADCYEVVCS